MNPRTYPVPQALRGEFSSDVTTLDEMEMYAAVRDTPGGLWASKVLMRENSKTLDKLLGDKQWRLPRGVVDMEAYEQGDEVVTHLLSPNGELWNGGEWNKPETIPDVNDTVLLADADVAFIARAFWEGDQAVILSTAVPLAFISAATSATGDAAEMAGEDTQQEAAPVEPPGADNGVYIAVVDSLHNDAVLELVFIAPGPKIYRRHNGQWVEDPGFLSVLKATNPPKMVQLEQNQVAGVARQVDDSTNGDFIPTTANEAANYRPVRAASDPYVRAIQESVDDDCLRVTIALLAVAGRELSPKDYVATERLRRYWLYGRGAAKIRWFTPGSWRRCYRHLVKYIGPRMTPGYCTNLSQRLGGPGVATHVGTRKGH